MNRSLLIHAVFTRMWRYKMKTFFMGLGITVSVLATVLLQTAAGSVRGAFTSFIEDTYPADAILLMAGSGFMGGGQGRTDLRLSDAETVANSIGVTEWDPLVYAGSRDVRQGSTTVRVGIEGHSARAETVRRRSVQEGEFFRSEHIRSRANVALIGSTTARELFSDESPIGAQVFIDNVPFEVLGVLETAGADPHGNDLDDTIHVPYTTLMDNILRINYISGAMFIVEDRSRVQSAAEEVTAVMREVHRIGAGQDDDFSVVTSELMNDLVDESFGTFNVFVPLIAGTAFLISILVIVGIMLISIKSRTSEIGLRKAVGARIRDVQTQILLEVLVVSAVASVAGLLLAQVGSSLLTPVLEAKFGVQQVVPPVTTLVVAVGAAMVAGLLAGALPARRAARLDPVEALS